MDGGEDVDDDDGGEREDEHKAAIKFVGRTNNAIMISRDVQYKP